MKFLSVVFIIFFVAAKVNYGQEFDRCWPLGTTDVTVTSQQANLVFVGNNVIVDTVFRDIKFSGACSSISDSLGNMKFFSNGCVVGTSENDTMMNGDSLNPGLCPSNHCPYYGNIVQQGNLILPDPNDRNKFIMFHESCSNSSILSPFLIYMSQIDLSLDSSRGAVTSKNLVLYADTVCVGSLTAVKHANGRDWWIVAHEYNGNRFIKFFLDSTGVTGPFFQSIGRVYYDDSHGTSKFSPDGNWYATSTQLGGIDLFKFNRCNGEFSEWNYIYLHDSLWFNSVEFSANSKLLYSAWFYSVSQFDLTASDISASRQIVATYDGFLDSSNEPTSFGWPQLAPNGKIYIAPFGGTSYFHIVEHPDSLGNACNVIQHSLYLGLTCNMQVPNFPNYRLGALDSLYCDSVNSVNEFDNRNQNISIFPNPSATGFQIQTVKENEKVLSVIVFDKIGREMNLKNNDDNIFDLKEISNGLYFVKVITNIGKYYKPLLIIK